MKFITFMRHSFASHNEAVTLSDSQDDEIYRSEEFFDAPLSESGIAMICSLKESIKNLKPVPDLVLSSPLTRALQTAFLIFGDTELRIIAVESAREACGICPCDRRSPKKNIVDKFGNRVNLDFIEENDTYWKPHLRETQQQVLVRGLEFVSQVLSRPENHTFIVSHGVFIETLQHYFLKDWPEQMMISRVMNCDICSFLFEDSFDQSHRLATFLDNKMLSCIVKANLELTHVSLLCRLWSRYTGESAFYAQSEDIEALFINEGKATECEAQKITEVIAKMEPLHGLLTHRKFIDFFIGSFLPSQREDGMLFHHQIFDIIKHIENGQAYTLKIMRITQLILDTYV